MISINPKYCALIANGKKTVEVRKSEPKIHLPFKCYIYCTKSHDANDFLELHRYDIGKALPMNQKVIGEFTCDAIENLNNLFEGERPYHLPYNGNCCLKEEELESYGNGKRLYGWHISELTIYDDPLELGDFAKPCKGDCFNLCPYYAGKNEDCNRPKLTKPPQSWCYTEYIE